MFPLALLNASSPPVDPSLTLVLLHFDGANGSTTFTDSSQYNRTFTIGGSGGISLNTAWAKFGASSLYSNNTGRLQTSMTSNPLSSGEFTAELWFRQDALATNEGLLCLNSDSSNVPINCTINNGMVTLAIQLTGSSSWTTITHQNTASALTDNHLAIVRKDGVIKLYLNGVASTSSISAGTTALAENGSGTLFVSGSVNAIGGVGLFFNGYADEFRLRKEAMYDSDFTPPTAPFTY